MPPLNIHGDNEVEKEEMEKVEEKESERGEDEDIDEENDDEEEEEEEMMLLSLVAACAAVTAVLAILTVEHIESIEPPLARQPILTSGYARKHNVLHIDELAKLRHSIGEISQSLEAMCARMERNCRHCWDVVKEMDMDDVTRYQVMELLQGKKTRDMFLDMTVQERKGWIEYKLSSNRSSC